MARIPRLTCLRDVRAEPIQWLWPGRIPRGKLTMLAGDPCLGKSIVTCDLAARVSRGEPWPDAPGQQNQPGQVLIMSAEDDPSDTIRPRFEAACGDPAAVHLMTTMVDEEGRQQPIGLADLDVIEEACKSLPNLRLVILDPVSAFVGSTDSHNNTSVRGLLAPLAELGGRYGISILAVTHLSKSKGGKALYRYSGSLAFIAAARAAYLMIADPNDDTGRRVLMLPVKNNLGPEPKGLAYRVQTVDVPGLGSQPVISWEARPLELGADETLAAEAAKLELKGGRSVAGEWLRGLLRDGSVGVTTIQDEAREAGFSWALLRRLKDEMGVRAVREGFGSGSRWVWSLSGGGGEYCEGAGIGEGAQGVQASAYGEGGAPMGSQPVNGGGNGDVVGGENPPGGRFSDVPPF